MVGRCGERIFKSSAKQDYGGEIFLGHDETDMASLTERDEGSKRISS